jgi:hypothetical protein
MTVDLTAYATADQIKAAMPNVFSGTTHDTLLGTLSERASRLIDALLGQDANAFDAPTAAVVRYYNGDGGQAVYIAPCVSITSVGVKATEQSASWDTLDAGTWEAAAGSAANPAYNLGYFDVLLIAPGASGVWTPGRKTIAVTARWGRTDTPPEIIVQAVVIQAGRWFKRGQQAWNDTSGSSELGTLTYTKKLDPDLEMLLLHSGLSRGSW